MSVALVPLLAQLVAAPAAQSQGVPPVLDFPEPGMDDPAAYEGYRTRFYRDPAGNTVQIYIKGREGRVVTLLANAANESVGFTTRDSAGVPVAPAWGRWKQFRRRPTMPGRSSSASRPISGVSTSAGSSSAPCAWSATSNMKAGICVPSMRHLSPDQSSIR